MNTPHEHLAALHRAAFNTALRGGTLDQIAEAFKQCLRAECGYRHVSVTVGDEIMTWGVSVHATPAGVRAAWTDGLGPKELSLGTLQAIHDSRAAFIARATALMAGTLDN